VTLLRSFHIFQRTKSENVVGICGADRIVLIEYAGEKKHTREKIQTMLKVTEEEIGCGYTWGSLSVVRN